MKTPYNLYVKKKNYKFYQTVNEYILPPCSIALEIEWVKGKFIAFFKRAEKSKKINKSGITEKKGKQYLI